MRKAILLTAALMVTGCATAPASFPTEVTRYRADEVGRGTIALVPDEGVDNGPEYQVYALAVGDALTKQGYTLVPDGSKTMPVGWLKSSLAGSSSFPPPSSYSSRSSCCSPASSGAMRCTIR